MPKNLATDEINKFLKDKGLPAMKNGVAPSATAMEKISEALEKMMDTDRKQGLTATEVEAFKGQVKIYLDQALTYENFLNR